MYIRNRVLISDSETISQKVHMQAIFDHEHIQGKGDDFGQLVLLGAMQDFCVTGHLIVSRSQYG